MTNYENIKSMNIEETAEIIADCICETHALSAECYDCSHCDKLTGGCNAVNNLKEWLESEVKENDEL